MDYHNSRENFEGQISQSIKIARWGVPGERGNSMNNHSFFNQYSSGITPGSQAYFGQEINNIQIKELTIKQKQQNLNKNFTQNGFKKFKNNQALTLKQLKQQYQILKNLSIEQKSTFNQKGIDSQSSSSRDLNSDAESKNSKNTKNAKRQSGRKQTQMHTLQKKQLELVIGNSMKKIQELLHNQMNYKKQIHQLKLQLDDKSLQDKYENIIRNFKKNQSENNQTIQSLKREIDRLKSVLKGQGEKISRFQSQILSKNQELMKNGEQKRKFDDLIKFQKQKFSNVQIELRKVRMQFEIMEKDKNNQISRLIKQIDQKDALYQRQWGMKVKRLEEQLNTRENRYNLLLDQFQQMKKNNYQQPQMKKEQKPSGNYQENQNLKAILKQVLGGNSSSFQLKELVNKIEDLKQQNKELRNQMKYFSNQNPDDLTKSQMFMDTINAIFNKIDKTNKTTDQILKKQIQMLRTQINQVHNRPDNADKIKKQDLIIQQLQKIIQQENYQKKKFIKEIQNMKQEYQAVRSSNQKNKLRLTDLVDKEKAYKHQIIQLRHENDLLRKDIQILSSTKGSFTNSQSQLIELRQKLNRFDNLQIANEELKKQILQIRSEFKQKEQQYIKQQRSLKRKVDQLEFETQKLSKQGLFNLDMQKSTHVAEIGKIRNQIEQQKAQKNHLLNQIQKMKAFYQNKLIQKNKQINSKEIEKKEAIIILEKKFQQRITNKTNQFQNIRVHHQQMGKSKLFELQGEKKNIQSTKNTQMQIQKKFFESLIQQIHLKHDRELNVILKKMEMLTDANEQFMSQNDKFRQMDRQMQDLRRIVKNTKSLSDGIDHLWQVKQTEYANLHEILKVMKDAPEIH